MDTNTPNLHSFDLYNDYPLPEWSSKPTQNYFLEIIKSGVILEEKKISEKEFYLVGRLLDLSDIVLEHPSISRKHAVLQHKNNGELFLYDLESTHGSFLNNRKVPPRVFIKLKVGDMLKFGASLRCYIVRCPELEKDITTINLSTDIGLLQAEKQQKPKENDAKKLYLKLLKDFEGNNGVPRSNSIKKSQENDENIITWGISDEEAVYNYQDENDTKMEPNILRQLPDLTEKQLEKIEQFEVKLNKYQNIETEYEELCRRERKDFGLDEASKAKKEVLEKKIQETAQQLETLEETLKLMIFKEKTEKRKLEKMLEEDTYNDDDYFDRTLETKKVKKEETTTSMPAEKTQITYNFQSLKTRLEELLFKQNVLNIKILDFQPVNKPENEKEEEEIDELEKYMQVNQTNLDVQQKKKLLIELEVINTEIEETKKLLRIVRPSYEIAKSEAFVKHKETANVTIIKEKDQEKFTKPREKISKTLEKLHNVSKEYKEKDKMIKDFTDYEKYRVYDEEDDENNNNISAKKIQNEEQKENNQPVKPKVYGVSTKPLPRNLKEKDVELKKGIEDLSWVPPKNQKGDGLTKLNDRFGY